MTAVADLEFEKMVVEMLALMSTTEGVVGLRMDGGTMPWAEVVKLYLPSWRSAQFDGSEGAP